MKIIKCTLIAFAIMGLAISVKAQDSTTFVIPANKAYAEPFTPGRPGVNIPVGYPENKGVVNFWRNQEKSVAWYLYQKEGSYSFYLDHKVDAGKTLEFELIITPCYAITSFKPIKKTIKLVGNNTQQQTFLTTINIKATAYYKYELKPLTAPESAITIQNLIFKTTSPNAKVNQTNYQSSPSVHLSFSSTAPTTKAYDWIYEEILVPEGADPLATYYMSLGFFRGYMGIQTNSPTERRVLFSVWDSKDAEHDKSIAKDDYVSLVDKADETTVNNFGGEGTGGQSYVKTANWKTGKPVKFLMNIAKQDNNSVVLSAWYQIDNEGWKYVASWRAPKEQRVFDGFYSFLENFGYSNGQLRREAYYYNAWGKETTSDKWVNFNKVRFSNTDGAEGQRVDYEQGVSPKYPDRFYMASGGYTPTVKTANQMPLAQKQFTLDLTPFANRVQQALVKK